MEEKEGERGECASMYFDRLMDTHLIIKYTGLSR